MMRSLLSENLCMMMYTRMMSTLQKSQFYQVFYGMFVT